jgi:hypothetical protein
MSSAVIIQLVLASLFKKTFFLLLEDIFFNRLTSVLYEVAETACRDLEDVLKIFALKKASNGSISILFFLVISFMVITKYYLSFSRMEYQANLLWIPKDSPYNLNEVCSKKVEGTEK